MNLKHKFLEAIINEFAPDATKAAFDEFLGKKTKEQAYSFIIQHRDEDWYDLLPERARRAIRRLAPTDLDWFDQKWVIKALAETNPAVASLILSSPELQTILSDKIERLKRRLQNAFTL